MTKAELIKAIEAAPEHIPMYVVDGRGWCGMFDISIVHDFDGDVAEIHVNTQH
jgi:hypothetical protein